MSPQLKIYIDRLKDGHAEKIDETINSEILAVQEEHLSFLGQISIAGQAYLAEDHLIINSKISSVALIPCSICNKPVEVPIVLENFYFTIPLNELNSSVFDLTDEVREAILLQLPAFAECLEGRCPERTEIQEYLKKSDINAKEKDQSNFPFADLN